MGVIRSPANRVDGKMLGKNAREVLSKAFGIHIRIQEILLLVLYWLLILLFLPIYLEPWVLTSEFFDHKGCWQDFGKAHVCEDFWILILERGHCKDRKGIAGSWDPLLLLFSLRMTHNHPVSSSHPLFTDVWWALPLPAAERWSCLQSPAWRAGCPTQQTGGLAQPGAIWMWATWTCDKKQKPWWGERPRSQHKIK